MKLANIINGSVSHNDREAFCHPRENSSRESEIRNLNNENEIPRYDSLLQSMGIFFNEINMKHSQEMDKGTLSLERPMTIKILVRRQTG